MHWRGDAYSGCLIAGSFTTVNTSGVPTQLQGSLGMLCVVGYRLQPGEATGFSCSSSGITLATSCGSRTGWNVWSVNTNSDPAFWSCGRDYELLLSHGLVGTQCVSGYLVASFSLKNRSGLQPQTHGRPLALTVGGAANINWAGVESCTNATGLTCTSIYTAQKLVDRPIVDASSVVASVTGAVGSVTGAVGSVTGAVTVGTNNDKTGYALSSAGVQCVGFVSLPAPANVPGWPMTLATGLGFVAALATDCLRVTSSQQELRNRADTTTIATAPITCTPTTFHRGSFF